MAHFPKSIRSIIRAADALLAHGLILCVRVYQKVLSPDHSVWAKSLARPPFCRHIPSCSDYGAEALRTHGGVFGAWLILLRVLRCVPWQK